MPTPKEQNFSNHARWDPAFHFFAGPIALLTVLGSIVHDYRHFSYWNTWLILVTVAATVTLVRFRMYSLMVQDRVIRLEERLRIASLCSEPFRSRVDQLTIRQFTALRFASDHEVAALAERALESNLSNKQIKEAIQVWRPDFNRV